MKLGGWARIGIIASIVWLLGCVIFGTPFDRNGRYWPTNGPKILEQWEIWASLAAGWTAGWVALHPGRALALKLLRWVAAGFRSN